MARPQALAAALEAALGDDRLAAAAAADAAATSSGAAGAQGEAGATEAACRMVAVLVANVTRIIMQVRGACAVPDARGRARAWGACAALSRPPPGEGAVTTL